MLEMGQEAKDKITGFKGILTARHQYITGCDQYAITPDLDENGKLGDIFQFDEGRIEIIGPGINKKEVQVKPPGGLQPVSTTFK